MPHKKSVYLEMNDIKENNLVVKSNHLVEASYRLTTQEQRIVLVMASMVKPEDEDFQRYRINVKDFNKLIGVKNESYEETKEITKKLLERVLIIKDLLSNSELQIGWLASAQYFHGKGYVELEFSPKLKPYLLELKERFTKYQLKNVLSLKSSYSIRIYELLKQYERIGERYFNLDEIKNTIGVQGDKYKLYGDFKRKILNKALSELKGRTDIVFTYKEKKQAQKVIGIYFFIKTRIREKEVEPEFDLEMAAIKNIELYTRLQEYFRLSPAQAKEVLAKYSETNIFENLKYVEYKYKQGQIKDIGAYTLKVIRENIQNQMTLFDVEKEAAAEKKRQEEAQNRRAERLKEDYHTFYRDEIENARRSLSEAKLKAMEEDAKRQIEQERPNDRFSYIMIRPTVDSRLAEMFNIQSQAEWIEGKLKEAGKK